MRVRLLVLTIALAIASAPLAAQINVSEGQGQPPSALAVVPRGDHFTIKFWPNRSWYGNSLVARIAPRPGSPNQDINLGGLSVELVRFERVGLPEALPDVDYEDFRAKLGKGIRELDRRAVHTDADGEFHVENLAAGLYSVHIDWGSVPSDVDYLAYEVEYPEKTSERRSLLVPVVVPLTAADPTGRPN